MEVLNKLLIDIEMDLRQLESLVKSSTKGSYNWLVSYVMCLQKCNTILPQGAIPSDTIAWDFP